jgi:glycosyltransferase involved in cell wall biosynthesis
MSGKKAFNIALDGGGFCIDKENAFGNYVFAKSLIQALSLYDAKNIYSIYSFCRKPADLFLSKRWSYKKLLPKRFWMKMRVSLEELMQPKDVFLALNQASPLITRSKIICFSHGLSFHFYPHLYPDSYHNLENQLREMIGRSKTIIVSSRKVREELTSMFATIEKKIIVLPFGIPFDMVSGSRNKFGMTKKKNYFLYVGMDHPIKNIEFIKKAFTQFNKEQNKKHKLYLATKSTPRAKLKKLYQRATALLTASYYESFNLPVLEALSQNCPVIGLESAVVPELSSYVHKAKNLKEFVYWMKKVVNGQTKKIDMKRLREEFSWKTYVSKLIETYD